MATQFWSSAVQIVGRLFGIVTTTPDGATGPLTGMVAFAFATVAAFASAAFAFALAFAALLLASAAALALSVVCCCSLSSFCSSMRNCCFSSAISASLPLPDSDRAGDATSAPAIPTATAATLLACFIARSPVDVSSHPTTTLEVQRDCSATEQMGLTLGSACCIRNNRESLPK